ncbi:MAG: hypothetical protein A3I29_03710 [Candidatus Magasanikbacteria bacterium RIFCSPLOWO2_02_FULL_44_11]|uniref:SIMPL domain-containing protein n=2 Tax=Candidatus Magasanikiibacteriota TaxID=1752731 RepID=A0A1F6NAU1_9BACT|nr:MAG: hypothetical protein A3I29_03710 [Candidatus Magasanikbacteria bacterium RIFCSPLOWO2_02_FULL_44_11]
MALRKMDNTPVEAPMANPPQSQMINKDHESFTKKILMVLMAVVLVYLTLFLGTLMRNNLKKYRFIGQAEQMERTFAVNGVGKVTGKNDVAETTIGFSNTDKDVAKAQETNRKVMDPLLKELKSLGIGENDLQSNYTIYPEYDYTPERGQQLRGFRVTNNIIVKIRDLTKVTAVLALPSKFGANEVSGLNFTIDDTENLRNDARLEALADAKSKARQLAENLGVVLGEVVSYSEYEATAYPYSMNQMTFAKEGVGGGGPTEIATGSREVNMGVTVVYKIYSNQSW